ncbi:ABC transporter ATP-binding protein [Eubacterium ventriosum]|jgi:ATP-binding cassette subfamily B protein|uniref:ABC transporter ATP-binding protein n=1 Tax=Eubacterium ventriosum TaxID=39496 RepID=A0A414RCP9_9FIRM|nr:ABC transporter ATP-binding protein [Eubacterium ventriosum]RHF90800.1 ABC transporter ATP-binding protein [Eubacterium ventriosum]
MLENLKKLVSYYKPYKKVFLADMFFAIMASFIALLIPLVVRYVTAKVIYMPAEQVVKTMIIIAIVVGILILFQCYCNYYIANYGHVMGAKIEYDMRAEIFGHFQKLSFSFYDDEKVGQLMSRITSDLFDITELLHHGPENVTISVIKIIGALAILLSINVRLALIAFLLVPFMLVYAYFFNKKMKQAFRVNRIKIAEINAQIEDNLSGIRVVKSFANEDLENKKFKVGNDAFLEAKKNNYKYMGGYNSGLTAFTTMINLLVIVSGGLMITKDMISVTDLVTFLLYINIFTDPIKTLIDFTEQFQNGYSGYERFLQILSIEPEIKDSENAVSINNVKGDIKLDDVSFKYNDSSHRVLKHINLEVKAGSYVALVGSSGAGKTTLCNLIPRFYEATSGKITIDGKDIKDIKLKDLRDNIGIVQQDVYLFVGTVYDNIRYGRPDATREEVIAAAKEANAYNFIMSLPNGFETDIGQRGIKLSGGQKQRISIARVFLKNPPILIFDEATSALDNESEKIVQESMEKLAKNRTTMVIAHRLSTIRNAEKILVLTDKGIEEQGTHKELMDKHGIYYDLYNVIEK